MKQRVAFLDRDGTLNIDTGHVHHIEQWQWMEGAISAIRLLNQHGFLVAIVTNQSAIAAGRCSLPDVERLHACVQDELERNGARVDFFAVCPHAAESDCECRKPRTGLARHVEQALGRVIDYGRSWMIGDKVTDMQFGHSLGTRTALIRSLYWQRQELPWLPDCIELSLFACVQYILNLQGCAPEESMWA